MNKEMRDALGLGQGTLRAQLIQVLDKATKTIEKRVHNHMTECTGSMKIYEEKVQTFEKRLEIWKDVEDNNKDRLESLEKKLISWEENIGEKIQMQQKAEHKNNIDMSKKIAGLNTRCDEIEYKFDKKLEALGPFRDSIKSNYASIEIIERKVNEALKALEEFRHDDMFINARNNYCELYQRLMQQEERYIMRTVPDIEELQQNLRMCTPLKKFNEL